MPYPQHLTNILPILGLTALLFSLAYTPASAQTPTTNQTAISAEFPFEKQRVAVLGAQVAYVDVGEGPVVLFLHGNPTSSYLWRNIIPYVSDTHRAIAPDLIGMGDSDKPDIDYTFVDHAAYVDGFIAALAHKDITLVVHDWGSALGMRYARQNPDNVTGLAFMEALLPPGLPLPGFEAMDEFTGTMFRSLRTPGLGEELVFNHNFFVESVLGRFGSGRVLSDAEMAVYRKPFETTQSRKPTLVWPRQIPIGGTPADVGAVILANGAWFYDTELPKLFFHVQPGALMPPPVAAYVITHAKNLTAVDLGAGSHFVQESSPHQIGKALATWLAQLPDTHVAN